MISPWRSAAKRGDIRADIEYLDTREISATDNEICRSCVLPSHEPDLRTQLEMLDFLKQNQMARLGSVGHFGILHRPHRCHNFVVDVILSLRSMQSRTSAMVTTSNLKSRVEPGELRC